MKYRHQGTIHKIEKVSDEKFVEKGFGQYFLDQYRKYAPDYEPFYDHTTKTYKMVSMSFLRKYGIKEDEE